VKLSKLCCNRQCRTRKNAKSALINHETKQANKDAANEGESAYNVAVADFYNGKALGVSNIVS